ncbi:hypothetical protein Cgig2_001581 [Carnegiea gigantea]|uniref:Uncharacterized protein n=1 Tax=Carnegiea gigantea TaxID=171969 RepID=A0A9Q1KA34_9CARY|nr:hypothetical protein Cgig2_001581 [Carnegiea gigantea]
MAYPFHPTRSISFPPRSLPSSLKIDESLIKLRSFEVLSSSSSTFGENIQVGLIGLAELYGYVQELILSPSNQHALKQCKLAEEALDGSVRLLDTCSSARDLVLRLKEQVRDLQSALHRKGCTSNMESELRTYMGFRKKMAKDVARCLKALKQDEMKCRVGATPEGQRDDDPHLVMVARVLREVYEVTVEFFRRFYLLLLAKPTKTVSGWSLISRLVTKRSSQAREEAKVNEIAGVDSAICEPDVANIDVQVVQGKLQVLDASIRILEEELGCVSKCLSLDQQTDKRMLIPLLNTDVHGHKPPADYYELESVHSHALCRGRGAQASLAHTLVFA